MRAEILVPWHVSERRIAWLRGLWRLTDPKIALASLVPFLAGTALAYAQGLSIRTGVAVGAFAAIFLVEVAKNAVNDLVDFRSGTDSALREDERSPFSGGKRTLVESLLTERDLSNIAWVAFTLAAVVGTFVAAATRAWLLLLGGAAAVVAAAYSMSPFKLSYRGLGELAVGLTYGPGIVLGSFLLYGGRITSEAVAFSIALGLLIANVLLINEVPDERADRLAGKRTLVVRLGRRGATRLIAGVFIIAFALPVVWALSMRSYALLGLLLGAVPAFYAVRRLAREPIKPPIAAQASTLAAYVCAGAGGIMAMLI
jgi:1,4-dihydroxy-2-naphthoate octaprenyltransferase